MHKFSTRNSILSSFIIACCIFFINYQAISQHDSLFIVDDSVELSADSAITSDDESIIYHFKLYEAIMPNAGRLVKKAVQEAEEINADVIIMELNTYGGRVDIADTIKTILLNADPLSVSYIIDNAISAGAFISIACDSIYMKEGATIGASTVVSGTDGSEAPDKYQSFMRAKMRATAEVQGRDPDIAEAMVDAEIEIEGITEKGKVLTMTASEALEVDFCDKIVTGLDEVIAELGIKEYKIVEYKAEPIDKIMAFLLNPAVSSILMLMIFGGIYFELQTPGIGFPLAAAMIGATLYFAPLYVEGMAASWEVVLFFVGIALLAVEIFVLPGFGIAGSAGLALIIGSLTLSLIQNDFFDFSLTGASEIGFALLRVILTLFTGIGLIVAFGGSIFNSHAFKKITLQDEQLSDEGYTIKREDIGLMVGEIGKAITDLRPAGKIEIEDEIYDAMSEGGYIVVNSSVKVLRVEGNTMIVRVV